MTKKPLGFGLGLRQKHVDRIIRTKPKDIDWFEVISENYFDPTSIRRDEVENIRQDYPFMMHGVSMSLGSTDALDKDYLNNIKQLENWLQPEVISDHICWTGVNNVNSHDLLPVPYIEESLKLMTRKIRQVQDFLGRKISIENPSTYVEFKGSQIAEEDFIAYLLEEADCNLLLDINNIYVNSYNHDYDKQKYIDKIDGSRVSQIHLAGHKNYGTHIIDTHGSAISDEVLELYSYATEKFGFKNTMIEWDADIPDLHVLQDELAKVREVVSGLSFKEEKFEGFERGEEKPAEGLINLYEDFQGNLLKPANDLEAVEGLIEPKGKISQRDQFTIYYDGYRNRLFDLVANEYPITAKYVGGNFAKLIRSYIEYNPSNFKNLDDYVVRFTKFAGNYVDDIISEMLFLESEISAIANAREDVLLAEKDVFTIDKSKIKLANQVKFLSFKNNVNTLYSAYLKGDHPPLNQDISGVEAFIILQKDGKDIYRTEIDRADFEILSGNDFNNIDNEKLIRYINLEILTSA